MTNNEITKLIHSLELACQLANTQQAEIERLKNELHGKVEYIHEQREVIDEKKAEIERLTEEINALNGNTEKYIAECEKRSREIAEDYRKEIKSEAIKDFAERLKKEVDFVDTTRKLKQTINDLVKEMAESEK